MAVTIFYGWVYNATGGSVLLTLLMHATEPLIWVNFTGADDARAVGLRVTIYAVTAVIIILLTGNNLGRKETAQAQVDWENATSPA